MGFLPSILTSIGTSLPFLLLIIIIFFFSTFFILIAPSIKKSLNNPSYPPIVATIFHLLFYFDTLFDYLTGLSKAHPTFRVLAPSHSEVYTVDPRNVEHILKTNFLNYTKGYYNNTILNDLFGEGIFAVDGEKWRQQRKLASFEFSTRVLKDFSCGVFRRKAAKLGEIIKGFCIEKKAFDIQDLLMRCTLDSIFEVGFGVDLNCLGESSEKGKEFIKAFDESNALSYFRYVDFLWQIKRVFNVGSEARLRRNIRVIDDFVLGIIKNKSEKMAHGHDDDENGICQETHKEDILSRFLMERKKEPNSMSDKYLRDIILSFIIAGKDTTANSLSWFFYMLCKHPSVQEKISAQTTEVLRDDRTNLNDFVGNLTDATLDKMQYLHAALTETLRLYPVVPIDGKYAEGDDILPDGFKMKKGDGINYMAYAMGRMKSIWGEDAEEFKPERWLEDGIFHPESPFKFTTFHAGPRICLGKEFAYKQMKIVSTVLLRFFRFELREEKEVKYKTMFTLHVEGGLHLRACSRLGLLN